MIHKISKERDSRAHSQAHPAARCGARAERPRLAVFRSVKHIYAQVIDDAQGHTLVAASSAEKNGQDASGGNVAGGQGRSAS